MNDLCNAICNIDPNVDSTSIFSKRDRASICNVNLTFETLDCGKKWRVLIQKNSMIIQLKKNGWYCL